MDRHITLPDWYEEDVVCFAAVPIGQIVDWAPNSYEPEDAVWPPEGTFLRLQAIAKKLSLPALNIPDFTIQTRLSRAICNLWLAGWDKLAEAVEGTPGAGWTAAIGLLLRRCARSADQELLIEGP